MNNDFGAVAAIIKTELERLKATNPKFSLREFAKRLGVSPTAVSEIIRGKRPATPKTAQMLIDRFQLDPKYVHQIQRLLIAHAPRNDHKNELAEIRELIALYVEEWNRHSAKGMASHWATDGCLIEPWGLTFDGRQAIEKFYQIAHSTYLKDARIEMRVRTASFAQKNSAFVDLDAELTNLRREGDPAPFDMHLNIPISVVKRRGRWQILASRPHVSMPAAKPWGDKPPKG